MEPCCLLSADSSRVQGRMVHVLLLLSPDAQEACDTSKVCTCLGGAGVSIMFWSGITAISFKVLQTLTASLGSTSHPSLLATDQKHV